MSPVDFELSREKYDKADSVNSRFIAKEGLSVELIEKISSDKNEPSWMREKRLKALEIFERTQLPMWGPSLENLNLNEIVYYIDPNTKETNSWDQVPEEIKNTFERLGIPQAERESLSGASAQYDSGMVYHNLKKEWAEKGIIFENMDVAVHKYPELVRKYFMTTCVPIHDHKFVSLHAAVWSGGTFIYIPENVHLEIPLQAYFRMNAMKGGQFEHTLIIVDKNSSVSYIEACSAPKYAQNALHAGCVEIHVLEGAKVKYSSIENWSKNTYNLNTKRAIVHKRGSIEWVNANLGSGRTMLYPCSILLGEKSISESLGIAYAGSEQEQDTGAKVIHIGANTKSITRAKSLSAKGGISTYRGLVKITPAAKNAIAHVECDALMLDEQSISKTYPAMDVHESSATISHEAKVGAISAEYLAYLGVRGFSIQAARQCIIKGFTAPIVSQFPLEYAAELKKLLELEVIQ